MIDPHDIWSSLDGTTYLDTAAHGVMPRATAAAVQRSLEANLRPDRFDDADFFAVTNRLRTSLARLVGGSPHEIALTTGATTGLQALAHALRWQPGDEIVTATNEFPIQYTSWKPLEKRAGAVLKVVEPRHVIDAITPRTRVVSVSHVRFDDGALLDVRPLADACHARGALLVLDVSQSCGAIPVDVKAFGIDAMVGAGYKWLLSPYGTGFFWVSDALLDALLPGPFSWAAQSATTLGTMNFVDPEPSRDAKRWDAAEAATDLNLNLMAMSASLDLVAGFGDAVVRHGRQLIDALFARLPEHCTPVSPLSAEARGPFGCFVTRGAETTAALHERLRRANVVVSLRGGRIRVAPHLFNTVGDIERLVEVIHERN